MRCLVTGASGFLGSHLVRALLEGGHQVQAIVRGSSDLWRLRDVGHQCFRVTASLCDIASARDAIATFAPEVAFHFAWTGGNSSQFVDDAAQVLENVPGTIELTRILGEAGCRTLVFAGSAVEYGEFSIPARESDPMRPANLYGSAKYAAEVLAQGLCRTYGMRFCGIRVFWTYGPMDDPRRLIPSLIEALLRGERPRLTEGRQLWDFLYIDDAVRGILALATTETAKGIFNLGSGSPVTIRDVADSIQNLIRPPFELIFGEVPYAPGQAMHLEADITRLRAATGWEPQIPLAEGLSRTVDWHISQSEASLVGTLVAR